MFRSLRFKLIFLIITLIVIIVGIGVTFVIIDKRQYLYDSLLKKAKLFGLYTAESISNYYSGYYVSQWNLEQFKKLIDEVLAKNKDVIHFALVSPKGKILFDSSELARDWNRDVKEQMMTDKILLAKMKELEGRVSKGVVEPLFGRTLQYEGKEVIELFCPVALGDLLASTVIYHVSLEAISQAILKTILVSIGIALLFIIIGVILVIFLANIIIWPIDKLSTGVKRISAGELNYKVSVKTKDEIGMLADSFNQMTENLQKITVSRDELLREIAMRKQVEKVLAESEQRYAIVVQQTGQLIYDYNVKSGKIEWKGAIRELTGFSDDEFQKVDINMWETMIHPDDRKEAASILEDAQRNREHYHATYRFRHKNGEYFYIEDFGIFLYDGKGYAYRMLGTMKDITERKKAEEELKFAYEQLKTTQAQLVQSAKMASVGQLAGGVAHEINNPLTGVLNNVQLIKMMSEEGKEASYSEFKELLQIIEESAQRCKKITQSLLDFSHASKGMHNPVNFNEVADRVIFLIAHELSLQNIVIQKQLEKDLPFVFGDTQLLEQIVFDIISNGCWAIKKRGSKEEGIVAIKTEHNKKENLVCISITDNGIGIAKENLSRIFEPFFTTKTVGEGTGLGLSIVYSIIQAHMGTVEVESELGKGATFKMNFPVHKPV